jgi:hypothetical protein
MLPAMVRSAQPSVDGPLGVFTRDDLRAAGIPEDRVRRRVADGRWHRIRRGVLVDGARWRAADTRERHLLALAAALRLDRSSAAVASGPSAVLALGLPWLGPVPEHPELTVPRDRRGCLTGVQERTTRAPIPSSEQSVVDGLRVTSAARTVVDLALRGRRRDAVVATDAALAAGLLDHQNLARVVAERSMLPLAQRLDVLREATSSAGSPTASVLRRAVLDAGLPAPTCGDRIVLPGEVTVPLLVAWPRERIVVIAQSLQARRALESLGHHVIVVSEDDVLLRTPAVLRRLAYALRPGEAAPIRVAA